jgi:AcrR family transcriptional regulator
MAGKPIWGSPKTQPARGRPAELTRNQITAAAVALADAEGLAAVTMRRVAAELNTGPASLYRHVATRNELVALMVDLALGEADPASATSKWRVDIVAAQLRWLRYLHRRPWLLDALDRQPIGPNALCLIEDNLRLVAPCPASGPEKMEAITVLSGLVCTIAQHDRSHDGVSDQMQLAAHLDFLSRAVTDSSHPHLAAALASSDPHAGESPEDRVARILNRVLDGLLPEYPIAARARRPGGC